MNNLNLAGKVYVTYAENESEFDIRVWNTGDVTVYENGKEVGEERPDQELFDALWDEANEGVTEETIIQLLTEYFGYTKEDLEDE